MQDTAQSIQPINRRFSNKQSASLGVLAVLFFAVILGIQVSQQRQETRQHADLSLNGYYKIVNHNSRVVDVYQTSTVKNAGIIQNHDQGNADSQQWTFVSVGGGYYRISNKHSGMNITVLNGSTSDGARNLQFPTSSTRTDQLWSPQGVGGGYFKFVNKNSGKVLAVSGSSTSDGTDIVQETYSGAFNQKFFLSSMSPTTRTGNLAYNKPVTVSSVGDSLPGNLAVDGNPATRWASARTDPQWIQVDLGATYTISQVILRWETAYASAYQIQISPDESNWSTIYSTTSGQGSTETLNVTGTGRYVRMYGTQRGTTYGYSLWEMEVYGDIPATPTPISTNTPTTAPTPTSIPAQPTVTIAPTIPPASSTPVPGSTAVNVTLSLHGIGTGGDSVNPNATGNTSPSRAQRTIMLEIYDVQNQLVLNKQGTVLYNSGTGKFNGTVDLGTTLPSGVYTIKIKTDQYLRGLVSGIQTITVGQTTTLPNLTLVAGDINGDNQVNIVDYNLLIGCYSDLLPPVDCSPSNEVLADINDDGHVNQFDYNLFLRELTNVGGQ